MARPRSTEVESRNVKLTIETYNKLDKYLVELITRRGVSKLTMNDAVVALLDEHHKSKQRKAD